MATTRKVVARKVAAKKTVKKVAPKREHPAKNVEVKVEVTIMVALGKGDPRSIEQVREDIKDDLKNGKTQAKLVTNLGGYYLVDGKVCLPDDYDPNTRGFKPGAHPPLWAMAPDEREILKRIEREKNNPPMSRQPQNLRTTQETDALHQKEKRIAKTKAALDDLYDNTEWGQNKKKEQEEAARSASEDEDEFTEDEFAFEDEEGEEEEPYFEEDEDSEDDEDEEDDPEADEDEDEDFEAEWDEDDPMNDEVAEEAVAEQTSSALAKLKNGTNGKTSRKVTTVAKPVTRKKVVRRR